MVNLKENCLSRNQLQSVLNRSGDPVFIQISFRSRLLVIWWLSSIEGSALNACNVHPIQLKLIKLFAGGGGVFAIKTGLADGCAW